MQDELLQFKEDGAAGVVFGCLNAAYEVDEANTQILTEHAHSLGLEATFHRAFDHLQDPQEGMEKLIEIGVDRILTSGGQRTAEEDLGLIRSLMDHSSGRIQIMAGSGGIKGECAAHRFSRSGCLFISLHIKSARRKGCLKEWVIVTSRIPTSGSRSSHFSLESAAAPCAGIVLVLYQGCPEGTRLLHTGWEFRNADSVIYRLLLMYLALFI